MYFPDVGGVNQPVQRVGRAGFDIDEKDPGSAPSITWGSVRVSTGVPLKSLLAKTSAVSPVAPASVLNAEVGTSSFGRRKGVPGSNKT
jgi:hypothetical protein